MRNGLLLVPSALIMYYLKVVSREIQNEAISSAGQIWVHGSKPPGRITVIIRLNDIKVTKKRHEKITQ
jgi:hypothetical protein